MNYLTTILLLFLTLSAFAQTKVIDLSGEWRFQMDPDGVGESQQWYLPDHEFKETITLPGSMPERLKGYDVTVNTQWTGGLYDSSYYRNPHMERYRREGNVKVPFFLTPQKHYVGKAWYSKTIHIDRTKYKNGTPVVYQLFLERPHTATTVWINGKRIDNPEQGVLPMGQDWGINTLSVPHVYNFTVPDGVPPLGEDRRGLLTITICVDNSLEVANVGKDSHSVSDQTQGNWNGIVGRMELREAGYIDNIKVYPDVDNKKALVRIKFNDINTISGMFPDGVPPLGEVRRGLTITLLAESFNTAKRHIVASKPQTIKLSDLPLLRGRDGEGLLNLTLDMGDDMLLWDEHCPQMYRLTVEVNTSGMGSSLRGQGQSSLYETYFGMRKIEMKDKMFYVNGKEIQLRGTVENCCFPLTGYPPCDLDSWLKLFETCKKWGLNHMRFHTYCPPEAAFLAADLVGFYIQPEGPSWPNHGVKLGRGEFVDTYLWDEAVRIMDTYGNHPSFTFFAFGNEPAGNWVKWSNEMTPKIKEYDPRHINCGFSVGGGWAWQPKVDFAVKAGARGLAEWVRTAPESIVNFSDKINTYNGKDMPGTPITMPFVTHEAGQWCAFPNFSEIKKYTGVNKAGNFEIFQDILKENGMESMAQKFLLASGKLQTLCYKYEMERILRTPRYAGFQLLSLNDYSGQGTALVGLTDVFFDEKGYVTAPEFREFCSDIVPLAKIRKFTYTTSETFEADIELSQYSGDTITATPRWEITRQPEKQGDLMLLNLEAPVASGSFAKQVMPVGQNIEIGKVSFPLNGITKAGKYTLTVTVPGTEARNHWDFWVYPETTADVKARKTKAGKRPGTMFVDGIFVTDTIDSQTEKILKKGGKVLLCAAGKISYGKEVKQQFLPVFWNTSWFKMRPPHTTGIYVDSEHPVFTDFPTDYHSDLQWWELVNKAQVMQFTDFPRDFQPLVQSIDTWFVSRKIGMLFEARVGNGRLIMTSMDILNNLDTRHVARQMLTSILNYMNSTSFHPVWEIDKERINDLFTKVAGEVNMYTNDSPDELKPALIQK